MTKIVVPTLGESVTEATIAKWLKNVGEAVKADEPVVELETDKVTLEVNAPADGVITSIIVNKGETVEVGTVLGEMEVGAVAKGQKEQGEKASDKENKSGVAAASVDVEAKVLDESKTKTSPAVRKLLADNNLNASHVPASGKDGRLTKADVESYLAEKPAGGMQGGIKAQDTAVMLTTFNEVDMGPVVALRNEYEDLFEKKHGIKLGFMSFFVKAVVQALKEFPSINSEIDNGEIVFKNFYNIGIAVSTPQGLVVPVIHDADKMSMAEIEAKIVDFGERARDGQLAMDELAGGTYTITNGGVFGSLMSTPILNTPQSGALGMHSIQKRPVVMKDDTIEVRPMMYLAQSYNHRVVDGREAVSSLVRIKQLLEDPRRFILDI